VIFIKQSNEIPQLLSTMDIFLFPSFWEGFGLALLEAQANGLPCIASTFVSKEVNITNTIEYLSLNIDIWISKILELDLSNRELRSENNILNIKNKKYDCFSSIKDLENIYDKEM
jgi:glycosyltransferase involved in cell wall biosynthesis